MNPDASKLILMNFPCKDEVKQHSSNKLTAKTLQTLYL